MFLLGLMLVIYVLVANLPFAPNKLGDLDFHTEAQFLSAFLRGGADFSQVGIARAPAPSLFYTIPYLLVSPGSSDDLYWRFGFGWTILWMGVSLLLIRRAAEILGGSLAGRIAGILVLASPFSVYYSYGITAEAPAHVGVALFVYGWSRWQEETSSDRTRRWLSRLALLGLVLFMLSRPNAVVLIPIAVAMAVVLWRKGSLALRRHAVFAGRCALWGAIALGATSTMGQVLPGRQDRSRQTDYLLVAIFQGHYQFREEPFDWRFWGDKFRAGSKDFAEYKVLREDLKTRAQATGVPLSTLHRDWIIADLGAHPFLALRRAAMRIAFGQVTLVNSIPKDAFRMGPLRGRFGYYVLHVFINASNLLLLGAAIWGMYSRRDSLTRLWPLWGPFVALLLFHTFVYMEARYLFPVRVIIAVMGSSALAVPLSRLSGRGKTALGRSLRAPLGEG